MSLAPARTDLLPAERQAGVSLWYIANRAGYGERGADWILNYVRLLHANESFPPPLPFFPLNGRKKAGIHFKSRWLRAAVDAWFDGFMPPQLALVAGNAQAARDAELLDARAAELAA